MEVFSYLRERGHEELLFCQDQPSGLKAVIAIHDTTLGPALGGCRMWPYAEEKDAVLDALRLAEGMTYKHAAMGLDFGGGKAVIIGDPRRDKSEALFRAFGKFVQSLGGRYITAEDVSVTAGDLELVARETGFVVGLPGRSGDPSPATAFGVFQGMKACALHVFGDESLAGRTVAIQGMGHVGRHLARYLKEAGARLLITDIFADCVQEVVRELGAAAVAPDDIYEVEADIFAPCALGGVVNDDTVPRLRCRIVAGSANNQLAGPQHGRMLRDRGILYAPDYVINGGGVINVADEFGPGGYNHDRSYARVATIYDKIRDIIRLAGEENLPTNEAADLLAGRRITDLGALKRVWLPGERKEGSGAERRGGFFTPAGR